MHVPEQRRSKLDDKSKKCVFLGVSDESKAGGYMIRLQRRLWLVKMSSSKKKKVGTGIDLKRRLKETHENVKMRQTDNYKKKKVHEPFLEQVQMA